MPRRLAAHSISEPADLLAPSGWTVVMTVDNEGDLVVGLHWGNPPKADPTHAALFKVADLQWLQSTKPAEEPETL